MVLLKIQPLYIGVSAVLFLKAILEGNISGDFLTVEKVTECFQVMVLLHVACCNGNTSLG